MAIFLFACAHAPDEVTFHSEGNPEHLSEWGLFSVANGRITPHEGMVTYELATPAVQRLCAEMAHDLDAEGCGRAL